jgi:hypothetical protein
MQGTRSEPSGAQNAESRGTTPPPESHEHEREQDPTTLKITGPVEIVDEDVGADPYNRTGRFRRLVR